MCLMSTLASMFHVFLIPYSLNYIERECLASSGQRRCLPKSSNEQDCPIKYLRASGDPQLLPQSSPDPLLQPSVSQSTPFPPPLRVLPHRFISHMLLSLLAFFILFDCWSSYYTYIYFLSSTLAFLLCSVLWLFVPVFS